MKKRIKSEKSSRMEAIVNFRISKEHSDLLVKYASMAQTQDGRPISKDRAARGIVVRFLEDYFKSQKK